MAIATPCQTNGAVFEIHIEPNRVSVSVLHESALLALTEEEAMILEANLHNVMELVLKPYFNQ
jgi:hypothetical protein